MRLPGWRFGLRECLSPDQRDGRHGGASDQLLIGVDLVDGGLNFDSCDFGRIFAIAHITKPLNKFRMINKFNINF